VAGQDPIRCGRAGSESKGSINKHGHYQTEDLMGIGVEVKDSAHFPEKLASLNFDEDTQSAKANAKSDCFPCHEDHTAVEHSFVPVLSDSEACGEQIRTIRPGKA
jgi:hypothetical protein